MVRLTQQQITTEGHTWRTEAAHAFGLLGNFPVDTDFLIVLSVLRFTQAERFVSYCTTITISYPLLALSPTQHTIYHHNCLYFPTRYARYNYLTSQYLHRQNLSWSLLFYYS